MKNLCFISFLSMLAIPAFAQNFPRYAEVECGKISSIIYKPAKNGQAPSLSVKLTESNGLFQYDNDYPATDQANETKILVLYQNSGVQHQTLADLAGHGFLCQGKLTETINGKKVSTEISQVGKTLKEAKKDIFVDL